MTYITGALCVKTCLISASVENRHEGCGGTANTWMVTAHLHLENHERQIPACPMGSKLKGLAEKVLEGCGWDCLYWASGEVRVRVKGR